MSQRAFLAGLDARVHSAFAAAGLADTGSYLPPKATPDATPRPVKVYVDRDVQTFGEFGQFTGTRVEVSIVREDGFKPEQGGTLRVDGDTYELAKCQRDDGSLSRWVVR